MHERISDEDLNAFLDGQLAPERRLLVEAYLAANPQAAALMNEDLRLRQDIALFLRDPWPSTPANIALSRQTEQKRPPQAWTRHLRAALSAAVFVGIGWFLHSIIGYLSIDSLEAAPPVPVFANEAAEAHRAVTIKLSTARDIEDGRLHLPARRTSGNIPVPELSNGLRIVGSDLIPWDHGTAVQVVYATRDNQALTLFAAEDELSSAVAPKVSFSEGFATAFWQRGYFVYALSGGIPSDELLDIAQRAAGSF